MWSTQCRGGCVARNLRNRILRRRKYAHALRMCAWNCALAPFYLLFHHYIFCWCVSLSVSESVSMSVSVCPLLLSLSYLLPDTYLSSQHRLATFACYLSKCTFVEVTLHGVYTYTISIVQLLTCTKLVSILSSLRVCSLSKTHCGSSLTCSFAKVPSQSHPRDWFEHVTAKLRISRRTKRSGKNCNKNRYTTHIILFQLC